MKETKRFLSIEITERRGVKMFYLYKRDDDILDILKDVPEEMEDLENLDIIMATKNAEDIAAYLRYYYDFTDLEVTEYLSDYDIIL